MPFKNEVTAKMVFLTPLPLLVTVCDTLNDSVPFVQFKKREKKPFKTSFKKPWKSVTFIKVAGF